MNRIKSFRDLEVYQLAFEAAMDIFEVTKDFPREERYSLTDQIRRSSRAVCANIAESWQKRRYPAHFVSKLTDAQSEAEETRSWLQFASRCHYMERDYAIEFDKKYDAIIGKLIRMCQTPENWSTLPKNNGSKKSSPRLPLPHSPPPK